MLPELGGKTEESELEKLSDKLREEHPEVAILKLTIDGLNRRISKITAENETLKKALDIWQNSANDAWEREEHNRNHPFGGPEVKW